MKINKKLLLTGLLVTSLVFGGSYNSYAYSKAELKALDKVDYGQMTNAQKQEESQKLVGMLLTANNDVINAREALKVAEVAVKSAKANLSVSQDKVKKLELKLEKAKADLKKAEAEAKSTKDKYDSLMKEYKAEKKAADKALKAVKDKATKDYTNLEKEINGKLTKINSKIDELVTLRLAANDAKEEVKKTFDAKIKVLKLQRTEVLNSKNDKLNAQEKKNTEAIAVAKLIYDKKIKSLEFKYYENDNYAEEGLIPAAEKAMNSAKAGYEALKVTNKKLEKELKAEKVVLESAKKANKIAQYVELSKQNLLVEANEAALIINKKLVELNAKDGVQGSIDQSKLSSEEKKTLNEALGKTPESLDKQIKHNEEKKNQFKEALGKSQKQMTKEEQEEAAKVADKKEEVVAKSEVKKEEAKKSESKKEETKKGLPVTGSVSGIASLLAGMGLIIKGLFVARKA